MFARYLCLRFTNGCKIRQINPSQTLMNLLYRTRVPYGSGQTQNENRRAAECLTHHRGLVVPACFLFPVAEQRLEVCRILLEWSRLPWGLAYGEQNERTEQQSRHPADIVRPAPPLVEKGKQYWCRIYIFHIKDTSVTCMIFRLYSPTGIVSSSLKWVLLYIY